MLQNATELTPDCTLEADVCVIGSGPAGLAAALQLSRNGRRCLILETGVQDFDETHQSVGRLDQSYSLGNLSDRQLDERRQIGGKSNAWSIATDKGGRGVRLLPYAAANFAARPSMGGVAWPFGRETLDPYYEKAAAFFEIPAHDWVYPSPSSGAPAPPELKAVRFRFSDGQVLGRHIHDEVIPSDHIRLLCNATALRLDLDPETSAIREVQCESEPGRRFSVRARQVVTAGGALASTQLLMRSDSVIPGGVGNQAGLLGRYFMDHPLVDGGQLVVADPRMFGSTGAFDIRTIGPAPEMAHLQLPEDVLLSEPVANINAMLYPRTRIRNLSKSRQDARRSAQAAWRVLKDPRSGLMQNAKATVTLGLRFGEAVNHFLSERDGRSARIDHGGWSQKPAAQARYRSFQILHMTEQPPRFENRVRLGADRDRFGERRVTIDWRLSDDDKLAIRRAQERYAASFRKGGWGEYQMLDRDREPEFVHSSLGHHIGTTRMHADPRQGVTDPNGRVHGVRNLFIASSALFPSGGWENPTLTVVALAIRLADHIASTAAAFA